MRVFPKPGIRVRDPVKRDFLPETGRNVSDGDPYWERRKQDGDVTTEPPASTSAQKAPKASSGATSDAAGSN